MNTNRLFAIFNIDGICTTVIRSGDSNFLPDETWEELDSTTEIESGLYIKDGDEIRIMTDLELAGWQATGVAIIRGDI